MPSREQDPQGYERRRNWHRNRALTVRAGKRVLTMKVAAMSREQLHAAIRTSLHVIYGEAMDGTNHTLMHAANLAEEAWRELEMRGDQLQLPLEGD
jgi:hypothetical protein